MKKIVFTCCMCFISIAIFSQERISVSKTPQTITTGQKEERINSQFNNSAPVESKEEILRKIAQIDSHIEAINIKTEFVLKDPEQKRIAEQEGWFEDMKATKLDLELKKQALQKSLEL